MSNNSANVAVGKPKVGGGVWWAPIGTAVPTDASTKLDEAFVHVGYCSTDGVKFGVSPSSTSHNAWGGDEVANDVTAAPETTDFTMIELNVNSQKLAFGAANVTATGEEVTAVHHSLSAFTTEVVLVVETIAPGGRIRRSVVPRAKLNARGEISYTDDNLVAYPVTFANLVDESGATSHDYYAKAA